ncbi:hypothetical protein [Pontibacter mangrovi]|uniref:Glycine zipper family protein n=1 Tax=Pontibacter mangrovi TaxID=2589816 RepID=A0A501WAY2_9BACT|nr:hypothetical protein [Pontibacter mangrovi]TPE42726.1 hypothetical protein FJM65_16840 [Pontibacter mangrovi]
MIPTPEIQSGSLQPPKAASALHRLQQLIDALNTKDIPEETAKRITRLVEGLNEPDGAAGNFATTVEQTTGAILKLVEKELKLVPQKHYLKQWMPIGIGLGLPFGAAYASLLDNMGLFGIGIPIGMGIGIAIGTHLDNKAATEGRQLEME